MKRFLVLFLTILVLFFSFTGCRRGSSAVKPGGESLDLSPLDLRDIVYEKGKIVEEENCKLQVRLAERDVVTGEEVTAVAVYPSNASGKGNVYYLVDWGDGTRSHQGPYSPGINGTLVHTYKTAGKYEVRAYCVNLDSSERFGWSSAVMITVSGQPQISSYLNRVRAISSSQEGKDRIHDNSNDTVWRSTSGQETAWIGYEFDTYYRLGFLEVKISSQTELFPSDFSIEFTTDRGENWYSLSKYYYLFSYQEGQYEPHMKYPDPAGVTLLFDLDGVSANGIRIVAKGYASLFQDDSYLEVAEMRVTGDSSPLFYTSQGGMFDADLNNMWLVYGTAVTEPVLDGRVKNKLSPDPFRTGSASMIGSHEWLEWDSLQVAWIGDGYMRTFLTDMLASVVLGTDGWSGSNDLVWATNGSRYHINEQYGIHYSTNSAFILGAKNVLTARNGIEGLLERKNSAKRALSERIEAAMDYLLTELDGQTGLLTIRDPQKDGTYEGASSNYWDGVRVFGYQSSYENILFYKALLAMVEIEYMQNNLEEGARYLELANKTKEVFNQTFWDGEKGRYITSVDINGVRHDFGVTYTNFMACEAGLASHEQAQQIYDWVDGKRIIQGETSTGKDIYNEFRYAARSNTVDMDPYFYMGHYEFSSQNGGVIFYTSYYDLMGRIGYLGADNALERLKVILDQFHIHDMLRIGMAGVGGQAENPTYFYTTSIIGEFPESGLVPLTFVTGFLGIQATNDGLVIAPALPSSMTYAGIREYVFQDRVYSIRVDAGIREAKLEQQGDVWTVTLPANGSWLITPDNTVQAKQ